MVDDDAQQAAAGTSPAYLYLMGPQLATTLGHHRNSGDSAASQLR